MRKFWSYISNDKYSVGCTGQTVYVYDQVGKEIAKFKDVKYAYNAVFSPNQNIFVVKSKAADLAIYSLDTLEFLKKMKFSKEDGGQDDGYCFALDGKCFYNIERLFSSCHSAISIYNTENFERESIFRDNDDFIEPSMIETDENSQLFVLGFFEEKMV